VHPLMQDRHDAVEGFEQTDDVTVGLLRPPAIPRVAVDFIEPEEASS